MKIRISSLFLFLLSAGSLGISLKLFYNMALFADASNASPAIICGGDFWLSMDWLRLFLLFACCILSLCSMFSFRKRDT